MKELKQLIKEKNFIQAKVWIINNRERIEEIADCLLEEIEILNGRFVNLVKFCNFWRWRRF